MVRLLCDDRTNNGKAEVSGATPLPIAAQSGNVVTVRLLLCFWALGAAANLFDAALHAIAPVVGSAVGLVPGGITAMSVAGTSRRNDSRYPRRGSG